MAKPNIIITKTWAEHKADEKKKNDAIAWGLLIIIGIMFALGLFAFLGSGFAILIIIAVIIFLASRKKKKHKSKHKHKTQPKSKHKHKTQHKSKWERVNKPKSWIFKKAKTRRARRIKGGVEVNGEHYRYRIYSKKGKKKVYRKKK